MTLPSAETIQPPVTPLNRPASRQPVAPQIRVRRHLNILIASMTLGGAERSVQDLIVGLGDSDTTINLFLMHNASPCYAIPESERVRVVSVGGMETALKLRTIALEVLASPLPVLYTHLIHARDLQLLWRLGVTTIPVIQNAQPSWQDPPEAYDHPKVPFLVTVADAVTAQMRQSNCPRPVMTIRHELQRWYTPEELQEHRQAIRGQYGIADGTLLIGMVGQFKAQKAYTRAVRVLSRVQQSCPARLMILGGWDHAYGSGRVAYTAACRQALELGVIADLLTPGAVQPVEPYFAAFDVFLNTSIYEGLSVALLEAIQSGCPVVTADAGGNREALPPDAFLIADGSDIDAYADAILRAARLPLRPVVTRPEEPDLIPRLWCLAARHGIPEPARSRRVRHGTLFVTDNINLGGPQRSLLNLLCHLPPDYPTALCTLNKVYSAEYLQAIEDAGVPVFSLEPAFGVADRVERVLHLRDNLQMRSLCFWNADARVKLLLAKALECASTPLIDVSPGPMLFEEMRRTEAFQWRIALSATQYFQRIDHFVAKYVEGGGAPGFAVPDEKVTVIPNGVPAAEGTHAQGPRLACWPDWVDPALAIGTCCRLAPSKRLEYLIEMMAALTERVPGVSLTIVGGVDPRYLTYWNGIVEKREAAGLRNLFFAGPHANVWPYLAQFKVFVMISDDQGCPNASLEAMAAGLPIVANASGGTGEQVQSGVNGYLVSEQDPTDMARRVAHLLKHPRTRRAFGQASRKRAQEQFSMAAMVERYLRLFCAPEWPN